MPRYLLIYYKIFFNNCFDDMYPTIPEAYHYFIEYMKLKSFYLKKIFSKKTTKKIYK